MGRIPAEDEESWLSWVRDVAMWSRPPWRVYHTRYSKGSDAGFPDLVLVRPPRLIFAELKTVSGQLTDPQRLWLGDLEAVAERGGRVEVYIWRPADRPEIEVVLR